MVNFPDGLTLLFNFVKIPKNFWLNCSSFIYRYAHFRLNIAEGICGQITPFLQFLHPLVAQAAFQPHQKSHFPTNLSHLTVSTDDSETPLDHELALAPDMEALAPDWLLRRRPPPPPDWPPLPPANREDLRCSGVELLPAGADLIPSMIRVTSLGHRVLLRARPISLKWSGLGWYKACHTTYNSGKSTT